MNLRGLRILFQNNYNVLFIREIVYFNARVKGDTDIQPLLIYLKFCIYNLSSNKDHSILGQNLKIAKMIFKNTFFIPNFMLKITQKLCVNITVN